MVTLAKEVQQEVVVQLHRAIGEQDAFPVEADVEVVYLGLAILTAQHGGKVNHGFLADGIHVVVDTLEHGQLIGADRRVELDQGLLGEALLCCRHVRSQQVFQLPFIRSGLGSEQ